MNRRSRHRAAVLLGSATFLLVSGLGLEEAVKEPGSRILQAILLAVATGLLAGLAPAALYIRRELERDRDWLLNVESPAREFGLARVPGEAVVAGRVGRFAVIVSRDRSEGTSFVVDGLTLAASIRREPSGPANGIGDDAFDARFHVGGDRTAALVCLTMETRRALLAAADTFEELTIEGGRIRAHVDGGVRPFAVEAVLKGLAMLAEALTPARAGARELAARFRTEALAPVRQTILEEALAGAGDAAATLARAAITDDEARIRLRAGEYLEDDATVTRLVEDPAIDGDVRAAALEVAARALEREDFLALLTRLSAAAAKRKSEPDAFLLALCSWARKTHTRAAQPALLRMLEGTQAVRDAAISGLAAVGDATAVGPLRALSSGLFTGEAGRAAENAIAAIQARLKGAEPGQVSLPDASSTAGALSEPESAGKLSIAKRRGAVPGGTRSG